MKRRAIVWMLAGLPVIAVVLALVWPRVVVDFENAVAVDQIPKIFPDYRGVVIPPNIAPLNFRVDEPGEDFGLRIRSESSGTIDIASRTSQIAIPASEWRQFLELNRGNDIFLDVYTRSPDGTWNRFESIVNTVAKDEIDNYLYYRLIKPIFILRRNIDICQRDLRTFDESIVATNRTFLGGCINCHTFAPNHPDRMVVHTRNSGDRAHESGMIVVNRGEVDKVDTRSLAKTPETKRGRITEALPAYSAWHPNGQMLAYSANHISQFFHAVGDNREVFDAESDLALYHVDSNTVTTTPAISDPDCLETFPAWSSDGLYLYFCSTKPLPQERYKEIQYDLMRIAYDPQSGSWGKLEPILLAEDTGLSIAEPRLSPDGRWCLFCMSESGGFPAYQASSDLYLLDLDTRQYHALAVNSPRCDSWHSWSSNSRWIAFASKRRDGLFARIYLSYVDPQGVGHKPVLLPQKDPSLYDRFIKTYNVPELSRWPAPASNRELAQAIRSPGSLKDAALAKKQSGVP